MSYRLITTGRSMWSIKAQSLCQFLQLTQSERIFERAIYCTVDERYLSFFDKDNLLSGVIVSSFPTSYTPDPSTVVLADFKGSLIVHGERQEARREYLTEDFTSSCFLFCLFLLYTSMVFSLLSQKVLIVFCLPYYDPTILNC